MSSINATSASVNNSFFSKPTNSTSTPYDKLFSIHVVIVVWLVFFLVCAVGNGLVCITVYRNWNMRTATNALLTNLAVADMLTAITSLLTIADFSIKDLEVDES